MLNLFNTKDLTQGPVKGVVYGPSGAGKTFLATTIEAPLVVSAEAGLRSIAGKDITYAEVHSLEDVFDVYSFLTGSNDAKAYKTIYVDSISEISEVLLAEEKKNNKDARRAYSTMGDRMSELIRAFRDIPGYDVWFTAKADRIQDDTGRILFSPGLAWGKLALNLPYFFDEVLALRVERGQDGNPVRAIQTAMDGAWSAKDRSGRLDPWEPADLGLITKKIKGVQE